MNPKTAEIISRTAAFRDRGISREAAQATLSAQYKTVSLNDAARTLGAADPINEAARVVSEAVYSRRTVKV